MFTKYRELKSLGKVSINLDGTQPELHRKLHDVNTGEIILPPRIDVVDVKDLETKRGELLEKIKDIDQLRTDLANAIEIKANQLKQPQEIP